MQILSLRLEQVKSYRFLELEFAPGANVIAGHNGAGKSTILEAIGFALFDSLPYNQRDFVREGEKTATVVVTFLSSEDERAYAVNRRCGGSNSYVVTDPETELKVCEGKADVQRFLRRHLGVEPGASLEKLFSDAVGVPQGTFTAAFHQRPSERKSIFDPLLQVDEYDSAWTRLREPLNLLRDRLQAADVTLAGLAGRLEQLPALERSVAERGERLAGLGKEESAIESELADVQSRRIELDAANAEIGQLDTQLRDADTILTQTRTRLEAAVAARDEAEAAATAVRAHQRGHDAYLAAQERRKALEADVTRRRALQDERAQLDKERSLTGRELERLDDRRAEIDRAEAELATLAPLAAKQEQLEQDLGQVRQQQSLVTAACAEQARLAAEVARLTARCETLNRALKEKAVQEKAQTEAAAAIAAGEESVSRAQDHMAEWRTRAETIKQQNEILAGGDAADCPVCRQPLTADHRAAVLAENEARLNEMRDEYGAANRSVKEGRARLESLRREQQEIAARLGALPRSDELDEARTMLDTARSELAEVEKRLQEYGNPDKRMEKLKAALNQVGDPRRGVAVAQAAIARKPRLEEERQRLAEQLTVYERELAAKDDALSEFAALDDALTATAAELEEHAPAYQALLAHAQLAARLDERTAAVTRLKATQEEQEESRAGLSAALTAARENFDREAYALIVAKEAESAARLAAIRTELRLLQESQEGEERQLAELRARQVELETVQAERDQLARRHQVLGDLRSVLREAGPYITRALIRQISENAARIFGELMQDFTRHLTWQEDYSIALDVAGNLRQFAQLSGGEQMSAALAVRLALLQELSNIDIAFFDEPTTNLDAARREALAQQILKLDGLRQLFVISHDDTFEQATDTFIRIERIDGESRITA